MFDMGKLYNPREGYMRNFGENPENVQMGEIQIQVDIFAAAGIEMADPEKETELTASGRQVCSKVCQVMKECVKGLDGGFRTLFALCWHDVEAQRV